MARKRTWTLAPHDVAPGQIQAILADLPALRGQLQPGVGDHGDVSGVSEGHPPQWMTDLGRALKNREIGYDLR